MIHELYNALAWTWRTQTGYNIVSGPLPDITLIAALWAIAVNVRKHKCHVQRCVRVGRHPVGEKYVVCSKHHPEIEGAPCTVEVVREEHRRNIERRAA